MSLKHFLSEFIIPALPVGGGFRKIIRNANPMYTKFLLPQNCSAAVGVVPNGFFYFHLLSLHQKGYIKNTLNRVLYLPFMFLIFVTMNTVK